MGAIIITFLESDGQVAAHFGSSSTMAANLKVGLNFSANFTTTSNFSSLLQAAVPVAANFFAQPTFTANLSSLNTNRIAANFSATSRLQGIINNLVGVYRFRSKSYFFASPKVRLNYGATLNFLVDVIPETSTNTYQQYGCRFTVNGEEYPIKKFIVKYPSGSIGMSLELTMARFSDYNTFTHNANNNYKFEISVTTGGVTTWHTVFDEGFLETKNINIGWSKNSPTDTLVITSIDSIQEKMSYSPYNWVIMYDVNRVEISDEEIKPIYDTNGNSYSAELKAFNFLTFYDVLNVIAKLNDISGFRTNIPNFQLKRFDIRLTDSYNNALNSILSPFKPLMTLINGELWLLDTTAVFPTGFPAPGTIKLDTLKTLGRSSNHVPISGFLVDYIENEFEGELYIEELITNTDTSGAFGSDGYQETVTETTIRKYYREAEPNVFTKELIKRIKTSVYTSAATLISENTEDFIYDAYGRLSSSTKEYRALVPDVTSSGTLSMVAIRTEEESISYAAHPFKPAKQIQAKRYVRAEGLVAVDSENQYFGEDFKQDYLRANEAGNLNDTMTSLWAPLWTITETARPTNNGQVKVYVQKIDHVRQSVTNTISAERTGDIELSGVRSNSRQIIVMAKDYILGERMRIESFNLAELPTSIGIPLVERWLVKLNTKNSNISFEWIGFNPYLQRGMIQEVLHRNNASLGKFILESIQVVGDNMGSKNQTVISSFTGSEV